MLKYYLNNYQYEYKNEGTYFRHENRVSIIEQFFQIAWTILWLAALLRLMGWENPLAFCHYAKCSGAWASPTGQFPLFNDHIRLVIGLVIISILWCAFNNGMRRLTVMRQGVFFERHNLLGSGWIFIPEHDVESCDIRITSSKTGFIVKTMLSTKDGRHFFIEGENAIACKKIALEIATFLNLETPREIDERLGWHFKYGSDLVLCWPSNIPKTLDEAEKRMLGEH